MKIRNGFISNSSSSSFVILGVKYSGNDREDLIRKHRLSVFQESDVVEMKYFEAAEGWVEETEVSLKQIIEDIDKLRHIFGKDVDIKWFSGMEYN